MATIESTILDAFEPPPLPVMRFSVEQYHRMIREGYFDEEDRFELLEGWIVPKMTRKPPHDVAIGLAQDALQGLVPEGWHIRGQSALTTAESEPEPDLAVVRGRRRDYVERHPGPGDMALVVEVADSSLSRDRGIKQRIYARARVPVYWIINLVDRVIEVYDEPTGPAASPSFANRRDFGPGDAVPVVLDGREVGHIAAGDLLP
jgi:Uma2 family endonuclease